jgi:hypothetical protein
MRKPFRPIPGGVKSGLLQISYRKRRASESPNPWTNAQDQTRIRSMPGTAGQALSSKLIASLVRSHSLVVRGDSWLPICGSCDLLRLAQRPHAALRTFETKRHICAARRLQAAFQAAGPLPTPEPVFSA